MIRRAWSWFYWTYLWELGVDDVDCLVAIGAGLFLVAYMVGASLWLNR